MQDVRFVHYHLYAGQAERHRPTERLWHIHHYHPRVIHVRQRGEEVSYFLLPMPVNHSYDFLPLRIHYRGVVYLFLCDAELWPHLPCSLRPHTRVQQSPSLLVHTPRTSVPSKPFSRHMSYHVVYRPSTTWLPNRSLVRLVIAAHRIRSAEHPAILAPSRPPLAHH